MQKLLIVIGIMLMLQGCSFGLFSTNRSSGHYNEYRYKSTSRYREPIQYNYKLYPHNKYHWKYKNKHKWKRKHNHNHNC
jgi:uncharacterized protein YceK